MRPFAIVAEKNRVPEKIDLPFVLLVTLLCGIGFTTLYSGSLGYGERIFGDQFYFVKKQAINLVAGIVAMFFLASINLETVRKHLPKIVAVTIVLSFLTFIPGIGINKNGASRWIGIGPATFQPSELVKLVLVLFLANLFAKKHDRLDEPEVSVYPAAVMTSVLVATVYLQRNFSTAILLILIALSVFFVAGVRVSWFVKFCLLSLPLIALMVLSEEYRVKRILAYIYPERYPLSFGYQVNAALQAISDGGFWGLGLGNGIRKVSSIPEVQSDFIFAVWCEEMGFIGILGYFAVLFTFAWRGFLIAFSVRDRFRSLLAFGCTMIILVQSLMNAGVVVRAFPATGIPLPFFSSGGSSLLITLCLCALIINVSRYMPEGEIQNV
jgi:cell division protein FtsW